MRINFTPLNESHFPLLLKWLEIPHVKAWWDQDVTWTLALIQEKYGDYIKGYKIENGVPKKINGYIINKDEQPIGYIQVYNAYDFARSKHLENLPSHLAAFDIFIGEPQALKQGIASYAIKLFFEQHLASYTHVFADPDHTNIAAIRTYENAGFKQIAHQPDTGEVWMLKEISDEISLGKKIKWAQNVLATKGYTLLDEPQTVRSMPWSTVICFQTKQGKIYLKSMAKDFSYEPALIDFLTRQKVSHLPAILANNFKNHCFLMEDAGNTLRPLLKESYDDSIIKSALPAYAKLQQKCIKFTDSLIDLGIMDFRLSKLPSLFDSFLQNPEPLLSDGLRPEEIELLQNHNETFANMCQALYDIGIPETLEQGDFHDNNILVKNADITFSDFGDAAVAHPFFSIVSFLNSAERHHHLKPSDQNYIAFCDSYINEWKAYGTHDKLNNAFNLAYKLRPFVWALSFIRIKSCPGIEAFTEYNGYLAESLKALLKNMIRLS